MKAFANCNSNLPNNQDVYGKVKNYETAEEFYNEDPTEGQDESNSYVAISEMCMSHMPSNYHIADDIQSLNRKECSIIFNIFHTRAKDYLKILSSKGNSKIDAIHLFLLVQVLGNHIL